MIAMIFKEFSIMKKKVNIIGAGIAGLSAGCYLQLNGYDTEIFELHTVPGGLCTAWKRKDFTFDTCVHWLVGSNPNDPFHTLWSELLDMKTIRFVDHEE
jgi:phytoene dehydrogenase-like protein